MSKKSSLGGNLVPKRVTRIDGVETTVYVREEDEHFLPKSGKERKAVIDKAKPKRSGSRLSARLTIVAGSFNPEAQNERLAVKVNNDTLFDEGVSNLDTQAVWIDGHPVKVEDLFGRFGLRLSRDEGDPLSGSYIVEGVEEDLAYFQEEFDDTFDYAAAVGASDSTYEVDEYGNKFWVNADGEYHREDGPAIEGADGTKEWWLNGQLHREDGPAIESSDGFKAWYINDKRHREDGPAFEWADGTKEWWLNGKRHREDGPAIEYAHGTKEWYIDGRLHREDGPAIERADGYKAWCINGLFHREDRPAVESADGSKEWFINGVRHREGGPAVERSDGTRLWYKHGELHREDGPAIEHPDGSEDWYVNNKPHREDGPALDYKDGTKEWYINGDQLTEGEFNTRISR